MHISVLKEEVIKSLDIKEDGIYVDCTLGYAGHSSEILKRIKRGKLFAIDQDEKAIEYSETRLKKIGSNYQIIKTNFSNMKEELAKLNVTEVDGILFDLGVSSPQLDEASRGFSYHNEARLDMRMDITQELSAYEVVNTYEEHNLANIFFKYGEEKYSKSIAKNIIRYRKNKDIETTLELVEIIKNSMPEKAKRDKHPAKKVFQAIRIEVNKELEILKSSILDAASILKKDGVLAVITFHSLEDRIVKNIFKDLTNIDKMVKGLPKIPNEYLPDFKLEINGLGPSTEEVEKNNRSRSSRLRVIRRIKRS